MQPTPHHRYVDTPAGQVHVAEAGGGRAIVLLPWFPLSGRMYADELSTFATLGFRVLAIDPLGCGRSAPRPPAYRVERHADAIETVLATLGVAAPVLLGGHFGGQIALELASRTAVGAAALVLDGGPFVEPAAVAGIRHRLGAVPRPAGPDDPAHRSFLWDHAVNTLRIFDPDFVADAVRLPRVHRLIADLLDAGLPAANDAPVDYPFAERLQGLAIPVVLLTAATDPLRTSLEPMRALARHPLAHVFPGGHPLHDPTRAGEYARGAADLLASAGVHGGTPATPRSAVMQ